MNYEVTVTDPTWGEAVDADDSPASHERVVYEYACHEGNYAMANILAGARAQEKDR
jgi:hypothetical protein